MRWAVIMAGGSGTRFWPLSSPERPKQYLKLIGGVTPLESCLARVSGVVPLERVIIVASERHRGILRGTLPDFPEGNVLWEPVGRNTAPCIAWANETILARDPGAVVGVFPSDHAVTEVDAFADDLARAYDCASGGRIVMFGIRPTRPETGYGYIEAGGPVGAGGGALSVVSFREKPDVDTARGYLEAGRYLWNSGMFVFDASVMRGELESGVPQTMSQIRAIMSDPALLESEFGKIIPISIDYAVMERTARAAVFLASFGWDDLGTWTSVRGYFAADADGNSSWGGARFVGCSGSFVYNGDGRPVSVLGLDDVVVVTTPDNVLVMSAASAQDVRGLA